VANRYRIGYEFIPGYVNDGDAFTYWESMPNRFPQSITVDLGKSTSVSKLVLNLPPLDAWEKRYQEIEVLVSKDGAEFTSQIEAHDYEFNPDTSNSVEIELGPLTTRFIRLTFTSNTGWPAAQLSELEVYE
jgi:hypothetical protein